MKIGLQIPRFTWPGGASVIPERLQEIAEKAEDAGFHSLWVMDHFFQIPGVGEVEEPMLEGYTTLGYLAGVTTRLRLGTLVSGVIYRYPGLLVKEVTTLDVISGGRAYFGIGAAWFEREARGLGVPFPPVAERFERLEEALQITQQMWSDEDGPYEGEHFKLEATLCQPAPLTKPHPPIIIGGM
jgi:F420-dependent oxidoreductase-like protein